MGEPPRRGKWSSDAVVESTIHEELEPVNLVTLEVPGILENSETQETDAHMETSEHQEILHVREASIHIDGVRKTKEEIKLDICMLEQARLAQEEDAARCATDTRTATLEIERLTQLLTEAKT